MFYNLFSAMGHNLGGNESSADIPLIIWLQGGPGASSQFGAFTELGPIRVENGTAKLFHSSWNIIGHLLFIDSPLNVGFSWKGTSRTGEDQVSSAHQAGDHLLNFLDNFYKTWPALKEAPLYITGESFGGHYVPAFARRVIINETWRESTGVKLAGISIGDGWTDPLNQVNFYDSYLWSVGIVDTKFRDVCTWYQTNAMLNMYNGNYKKVHI
jgi:carboxypeptidase C (cathepsin A)